MNKYFLCLGLALIIFCAGCSNKINEISPPESQNISVWDNWSGDTPECKCEYHKTTKHTYDKQQLKRLGKEVYKFAIMSSNAYDYQPQIKIPRWRRIERHETQKGFGADVYLSDSNELVIAFRGTDGWSPKDWFWGNLNLFWKGQYADADNLFTDIRKKHIYKTVIATGHSLGGGLAMHIAIHNDNVDAFAFDPSPRVFAKNKYDNFENRIVIISESGEALSAVRKVFVTMKKIKPEYYRYNFLGGNMVKEHGIKDFAQCMYKAVNITGTPFNQHCIP